MAIFHRATITPTKEELIADWVPTQPWGPSADVPVDVIGSYRFDDPNGRVGMETHLVTAGGTLLHVPLTYRDEPLDGAEDALITEMQHSVLGPRWVYDGLRDPLLVAMLAGVAMTGQGEALGMVVYDGRWYIAPSKVRIHGGGWTQERVPVDGFETGSHDATEVVLHNDRFELTVFRRPAPGPRPAIGLTATWDEQPDAVVLAELRERQGTTREAAMSQVRVHNFSISLDGFGTGDGITFDAPFGHAGERLHEWMFATRFWRSMIGGAGGTSGVDHSFAERFNLGFGAEIMGRGKFGPQTGPWTDVGTDDEWRGWWGPNPPFHTPVFVLTHHPRPSIEMEGGTVFHFVDASPQEVLDLARDAAGDLDVRIGGGPTVVRDFLAANLLDVMHVVQVPILLGRGVRLWDGLEDLEDRYEIEAVSSPSGVTHLTFTRR